MIEFLCFIAGGILTGAVLLIRQRGAHGAKMLADERKYMHLWVEATELLGQNGQLTDEQLAKIRPPKTVSGVKAPKRLPRGTGTSADRARLEIVRAKKKLPPGDNLDGMTSADASRVRMARIEHGTAQ